MLFFSSGSAFSLVSSIYDGQKRDRQWSASCNTFNPQKRVGVSVISPYLNDWYGSINYECPDGNILTAIHGNYSSNDRRYKIQCTFISGWQRGSCQWSSYSSYRNAFHFWTPVGKFLIGVKSAYLGLFG